MGGWVGGLQGVRDEWVGGCVDFSRQTKGGDNALFEIVL